MRGAIDADRAFSKPNPIGTVPWLLLCNFRQHKGIVNAADIFAGFQGQMLSLHKRIVLLDQPPHSLPFSLGLMVQFFQDLSDLFSSASNPFNIVGQNDFIDQTPSGKLMDGHGGEVVAKF